MTVPSAEELINKVDFLGALNLVMAAVSLVITVSPLKFNGTDISIGKSEFEVAMNYCLANPDIFNKIIWFSLCSAAGQSFIFFTIANFDSLTCTTVTTTRKVMSTFLVTVAPYLDQLAQYHETQI